MPVNQVTAFIPTLWSARINENLNKSLVLASLVNKNYDGEVKFGNTVKIQRPGRIAVADYDPAVTSVTYAVPTAASTTLAIDIRKSFGFQLDDLDQVQSKPELLEMYAAEAAYSMAGAVDQSITALYTAQGAGDVAVIISSGDMYAAIVAAGRNLDLKDVPRIGRWVVVSPVGYAALLTNTKFTQASAMSSDVIITGKVGMVAGFDVYVSNNLVNPATTVFKYLYGTNAAITHARGLETVESLRLETKFADGVRGQLAWGNKVIEPNALGTISATE